MARQSTAKSTRKQEEKDAQARTIAEAALQAVPYNTISRHTGVPPTTISGLIHNNKTAQDVIETGSRVLMSYVPQAIDNYKTFLSSDNQNIRLKASQDLLKITGYLPSHTPVAQIFQQMLYVDNRNSAYLTQEQQSELQDFMSYKLGLVAGGGDNNNVGDNIGGSNGRDSNGRDSNGDSSGSNGNSAGGAIEAEFSEVDSGNGGDPGGDPGGDNGA